MAERQAQRALDEADLSGAMARPVSVALGPVSDQPNRVSDVLARGQAIADRLFATQPRVRANLLRQLDVMWAEGGDWARTDSMLHASRAAAVSAGDVTQAAQADCILAIVSAYQGDFVQAQARVEAGLAVAQASPADRREAVIECLANRSSIADAQGLYSQALADLDAALRPLGTPRLSEQDTLFDRRIKRAQVLSSTDDMPRAVAEYDSLLKSLAQRGELDITAYNPSLNHFANVLLRAGQLRRALEVLRQLLARQQGQGAGRDREPAEAVNEVIAMTWLAHTADAVALADATLAQPVAQANPQVRLRAHMAAAEARCIAGEAAGCASHVGAAARLLADKATGNIDVRARLLQQQARLALLQGRPAQARSLAESALEAAGPKASPRRRVGAWMLAADAALALGQPTQAREHAAKGVAEARLKFAGFAQLAPLGMALCTLGQAALAAGDSPAARAAWREAVQQLDAALGADAPAAQQVHALLAKP